MNATDKIRSLLAELRVPIAPAKAAEHWALVGRLLSRATSDAASVQRLVASKDVPAAEAFLRSLESQAAAAAAAPAETFPKADLDRALTAFTKRLKLTRLDSESKLTNRPMTDGKPSGVDAIRPPDGFPAGVWRALVKSGKLRDVGGGFYMEA
jgi:hypothetical protein